MRTVVVTGGAKGADNAWARFALRCGHRVQIISFDGHQISKTGLCDAEILKYPSDKLVLKDKTLQLANLILQRKLSANGFVKNLLRRNVVIVEFASVLLAVGKFIKPQQIDGGTAWGCAVFAMLQFQKMTALGEPTDNVFIQSFFYDQATQTWWRARLGRTITQVVWIKQSLPTSFPWSHRVACIGTRDLTPQSQIVIKDTIMRLTQQ